MRMKVCNSLGFSGGDGLLKAGLCVMCRFDVVFVLYTVCAPICFYYHLNGVDTGIFELSGSNGTE